LRIQHRRVNEWEKWKKSGKRGHVEKGVTPIYSPCCMWKKVWKKGSHLFIPLAVWRDGIYWASNKIGVTPFFLYFCVKMKWATPQDVKNTFRHASFLSNNRVVFNVKGNDYRIVCAMDYPRQAMYIKFVGTHGEYNAINAKEIK